MKYITYRKWLKYGKEDDNVECTTLYHDTVEKAIAYAHRYAHGIKFVSVTVEDEEGNVLYEICDYGAVVIDYRKKLEEKEKQELEFKEEKINELAKTDEGSKKVMMLVSRQAHSIHQFVTELPVSLGAEGIGKLIEELIEYKGEVKEPFSPERIRIQDFAGNKRRARYARCGEVDIILCNDFNEVLEVYKYYKKVEEKELEKYLCLRHRIAVKERHKYTKIKEIVEHHLKLIA